MLGKGVARSAGMNEGANMGKNTCYMCEREAISVEHVPPKCFFPEKKDLPEGTDYRVNLITVPACEEHNAAKSKNDEYLLALIASQMENSEVAAGHFSRKILRALEHSKGLRKRLTNGARKTKIGNEHLLALKIDRNSFYDGLAKMVRGIYFHSFEQRLLTPVQIHCPQMWDENIAPDKHVRRLCDIWYKAIAREPVHGMNPEVFSYQLLRSDSPSLVVMKMVFYSGVEVLALSGDNIDGIPCA